MPRKTVNKFIMLICSILGIYNISKCSIVKIPSPFSWKPIVPQATTPRILSSDFPQKIQSRAGNYTFAGLNAKTISIGQKTAKSDVTAMLEKDTWTSGKINIGVPSQLSQKMKIQLQLDKRNSSKYRQFLDSRVILDPSVKYKHQLTKFKTRNNNREQTSTLSNENKCFHLFWRKSKASKETSHAKSDRFVTLDRGYGNCNKYITISEPMGQTGNQMFQVAALLGIAHKFDAIPIIPTSFPLARWFNLPNTSNITLTSSLIFQPEKSSTYDKNIDTIIPTTNITLYGYFQSWKYFQSINEIIRKVFRPKERYKVPVQPYMHIITKPEVRNICIHVRRGDMIITDLKRRGYSVANITFINKAIDFFRKKLIPVQFIVISDGMMWCKENIKGNDIIFSPFLDVPLDLTLIASCDDVIITSGTFGWWGAFLARGTTVYFSGYPGKGTWLDNQTNHSDYYLPHWIGMP